MVHFWKNPIIYAFQLYKSTVCVRKTEIPRDRETGRRRERTQTRTSTYRIAHLGPPAVPGVRVTWDI